MLFTERKEVLGKYLDVHGAAPRRDRMMKQGLELLKKKGDERRRMWEAEIVDRKDDQEREIQRMQLDKSHKQSQQSQKAKQMKLLEEAAEKDALQQVPQCAVEEKEKLVRRAARVKMVFHFLFSSASLLIATGIGMLMYAYFMPISQQDAHRNEMFQALIIGGPDDYDPENHYQQWMLLGSKEQDAVSMDYYLYNITNVDTVLAEGNTVQLHVKEVGPYRYKRYHRKINVEFESTNLKSEIRTLRLQKDLCTYSVVYDYRFIGKKENGDAQLDDYITTVNIAYLRVLGELQLYETTDRYLVAHFAAGLLKEQNMLMKTRIKRLGLQKILAKIVPIRLRKMYVDMRVPYAIRAIQKLYMFGMEQEWPLFYFAQLFAQNAPEISSEPSVAAFALDPELTATLCRKDFMTFQDVNLNPAKPATCISQELSEIVWSGQTKYSIRFIPNAIDYVDEFLAGETIRIYKEGGFTMWLKDALLYEQLQSDPEAAKAVVQSYIDVFVEDYYLAIYEVEIRMIFKYVIRLWRAAWPYAWLTSDLKSSPLSRHAPQPCAALTSFVSQTPQYQVAEIALALWDHKTIQPPAQQVAFTKPEGHDRWLTVAMAEFFPASFNTSSSSSTSSSTISISSSHGEPVTTMTLAAAMGNLSTLSNLDALSPAELQAGLKFADVNEDSKLDSEEVERLLYFTTVEVHSRARTVALARGLSMMAALNAPQSFSRQIREKPKVEVPVSAELARCIAAHTHQNMPVTLGLVASEIAYGEINPNPEDNPLAEISVIAAESQMVANIYSPSRQPADFAHDLRWLIQKHMARAAQADALEMRKQMAMSQPGKIFADEWAKGKNGSVSWPWMLGSTQSGAPGKHENATLNIAFATALWDASNSFSLLHTAAPAPAPASATAPGDSFFSDLSGVLSFQRASEVSAHVTNYTLVADALVEHAAGLQKWRDAATARATNSSGTLLELSRSVLEFADLGLVVAGVEYEFMPVLTPLEQELLTDWRAGGDLGGRTAKLSDPLLSWEHLWLHHYATRTDNRSSYAVLDANRTWTGAVNLPTFPVARDDLTQLSEWLRDSGGVRVATDMASAWSTKGVPYSSWPSVPPSLRSGSLTSDWETIPDHLLAKAAVAQTLFGETISTVQAVNFAPMNLTFTSALWDDANPHSLVSNFTSGGDIRFTAFSAGAYMAGLAEDSSSSSSSSSTHEHPLFGEHDPAAASDATLMFAEWMRVAELRVEMHNSKELLALVLDLLNGAGAGATGLNDYDLMPLLTPKEQQLVQDTQTAFAAAEAAETKAAASKQAAFAAVATKAAAQSALDTNKDNKNTETLTTALESAQAAAAAARAEHESNTAFAADARGQSHAQLASAKAGGYEWLTSYAAASRTPGASVTVFPLSLGEVEALCEWFGREIRGLSLARYWIAGGLSLQHNNTLNIPSLSRYDPCTYTTLCQAVTETSDHKFFTGIKDASRASDYLDPKTLFYIKPTISDLTLEQQYYLGGVLFNPASLHPLSLTSSGGAQHWITMHQEFVKANGAVQDVAPESGGGFAIETRSNEWNTLRQANLTLDTNIFLAEPLTGHTAAPHRAVLSPAQVQALALYADTMRRMTTGWQIGPLLYSPSTGWSQDMGQGLTTGRSGSEISLKGVADGLGTARRSWWHFDQLERWLDCSTDTTSSTMGIRAPEGMATCTSLAVAMNRHAHLVSFQPAHALAIARWLASWLNYNPSMREYVYDVVYPHDRGFGPQARCSRPDDIFGSVTVACSDQGVFRLYNLDGDDDESTLAMGVVSFEDVVAMQWATSRPLGYDVPGTQTFTWWLREYKHTMGIGKMPVWGAELGSVEAAAVWGAIVNALNTRVAGSYFVENHPLLDLSGSNVLALLYQFYVIFLPWTERNGRNIIMTGANREKYETGLAKHEAGSSFDAAWSELSAGLDEKTDRCKDHFEVIGQLNCKQASDLFQFIMWLGKEKVWDERLDLPGKAKGIFVDGSADIFLNTGYSDALLSMQGKWVIRPLGVRFADVASQERVPSMIRDHNRTDGRGQAFVGPFYAEDSVVTEPHVNTTVFPFPRTLQTGVHDAALMGKMEFLRREPVASKLSLYWRPGARSKEMTIFRNRELDAVGGYQGFGEDFQFPASLDVFSSPDLPEIPWWDDSTLRQVPLKLVDDLEAKNTAKYAQRTCPKDEKSASQSELREPCVDESEYRYSYSGVETPLRRYEYNPSNAPRYFTDASDPSCMIDVSSMYQSVSFFLGKPGYGGCDSNLVTGVLQEQRVVGLGEGEFATSESYFDYEPVTGQVYYHNMHHTMYANQPFSMEFFYTGVKPAMVPYVSLRKHHAHLSHTSAKEFADTVTVLKTKMAVTAFFGVVLGLSLLVTGITLYIKTQKRWKRTQIIFPEDDFKMRVEARKQVLFQHNAVAFHEAKKVFKNKSAIVREERRRRQDELMAAMAQTQARNEEIFTIIDGMVGKDEKGDPVIGFGTTPKVTPTGDSPKKDAVVPFEK